MIVRIILGDQLNYEHPWFNKTDREVIYTMMEIRQETDYVLHHSQKVIAFFAAMRSFEKFLLSKGHRVHYFRIDDTHNTHTIHGNLLYLNTLYDIKKAEYLEPDEYRLDLIMKKLEKDVKIPVESFTSEHFYTSRFELKELFAGKRKFLMENFYRSQRRKHYILMKGEEPIGGEWNFDKENRETFPKEYNRVHPLVFEKDFSRLFSTINYAGIKSFGDPMAENFHWPVNRKESLALLDFFLEYLLPYFGKYQDVMSAEDRTLFHSRLSFSLNTKMLSPDEVVNKSIEYWKQHPKNIPLSSVEGFIRQILGWREYMRGIYWAKMPGYKKLNYFKHAQPLPGFYWTGDTKMNCLSTTIKQSLHFSYAHHIQRLMITGNFALLAGVNPDEVDAWYLGIYIDAIEWVELPNTRGMSQFADGGIIATKPYVSSASYINKMSNYCGSCFYNKNLRYGENACPFNSLYWHFFHRNKEKLGKNNRTAMMYATLEKMDKGEKKLMFAYAESVIQNPDKF